MNTQIKFSKYDKTYILGILKYNNEFYNINIDYDLLSSSDKSIVNNFINLIHTDENNIVIDNYDNIFDGNIVIDKIINNISVTYNYNDFTQTKKNKIIAFIEFLFLNKQND
jgi:hypothetical protein